MLLSEWARQQAPDLDVVSASVPEPSVHEGDVIAISRSVDDGQRVVKEWERIESADQRVGFVALGVAPDSDVSQRGPDPEGVTKTVGNRAAVGGLIGALVGVAIGAIVGAVTGSGTATMVAILAGAGFGAVAGAMFVVTLRTGWGEASRHSFVAQQDTAMTVCLISCSDDNHRDRALALVSDAPNVEVRVVGRSDVAPNLD